MSLSNKTFIPVKKNHLNCHWFIIDCKGQKLGRIATVITTLLKGKLQSDYYPSIQNNDYIVLINTDLIILNPTNIHYLVYSPGRPGSSLKIKNSKDCLTTLTVKQAVKGMLSNKERKKTMRRLKIYRNESHPYPVNNLKQINFI